jgi:membrane protease YdiL (CAAX protease family)
LILLPFLYVLLVEKKSLEWLGFSRHGLQSSMLVGVLITSLLCGIYCPIFFYYLPMMEHEAIDLYSIFSDVIWYPIYEELTYRAFALTHFAEPQSSCLSTRTLSANILQSLLFLSIHKHHFSVPLVLVPVFLLGILSGFLFIKTRNIYGCILTHSTLNGFALLLRYTSA